MWKWEATSITPDLSLLSSKLIRSASILEYLLSKDRRTCPTQSTLWRSLCLYLSADSEHCHSLDDTLHYIPIGTTAGCISNRQCWDSKGIIWCALIENKLKRTCLPQSKCRYGASQAVWGWNVEASFLFQFSQTCISKLKYTSFIQQEIYEAIMWP